MTLSWNEIKDRALAFSLEWAGTTNEEAEAKSFLEAFFNVFGISRRKVSTFEHKIRKLDQGDGYIDLLWKGTILVEMKSRGKNLDRAYEQARNYLHGLKDFELPKYILVSDFEDFRLYDLEESKTVYFKIHELVKNVQHFGYLLGYQKKEYKEQDPANIQAAELMGKLHDQLKEIGYTGHPLELYLVRILFCLFAEDTTIFNKQQFQDFLEQRTSEDGSDLAARLQELFQVLNTPKESRFKNLDEQLAEFPYVNGKLYEELLPMASFDSKMRQALLNCCYMDWSKISPAIFGSMFQSVMNPKERRNLGAHYTSEKNILKLIKPLFLDDLWAEYESVKDNRSKLMEFHKKLSTLRFLDPACGCGNFLVITYRELRILELDILRQLFKNQLATSIESIIWLDVDMMYGIEYEEFPARIAEVAMWLIDHQMNLDISLEFGQYFVRLPLKKAAKIVNGDALEIDWNEVVCRNELSYIIGNPPFIGAKIMTQYQRNQVVRLFGNRPGTGTFDYVCAWYLKAALMIQGTEIEVAFVSTNSISQGEQVALLWDILFPLRIRINFAHRTFKWNNEAKGNAAVHVVIIGFALNSKKRERLLFDYQEISGEPHVTKVKNINAYLLDSHNVLIFKRSKPICNVPEITYGSMANDGGHLILSDEEKNDLIKSDPQNEKFIRPFLGSYEFINGIKRWCLWLDGINPQEYRSKKEIINRIEKVKNVRLASTRKTTQELANFPMLFGENRQPKTDFLLIPGVSSENRKYIPIGFLTSDYIASDLARTIPNANPFMFGVLTSEMHMAWVRNTCGRLKSDFRYSNTLVYNNFPWPESPSEKNIKAIEAAAQKVLDARALYPDSSLADLYDPLTMPPILIKAHQELDRAVDLAYRPQAFISDAKRMEFLFELYEKYTADLFTKTKDKRKR